MQKQKPLHAIATLGVLISLGACGDRQTPERAASQILTIDGEIIGRGGDDGTITLERAGTYVGFTFEEIATTPTLDGRFRFELELAAPELLYLSSAGHPGKAPIFVGNDKVSVSIALDGDRPTEVGGSTLDAEFRAFQAAYGVTEEALERAEEDFEEANEAAEAGRIASARTRRDSAAAAQKELSLEWVKRSRDTTLGAYVANRHLALQMDVDELEPLVAVLDPALAGTPYYDQLDRRLQTLRRVAIGAAAPNFSGPTPGGPDLALGDLRGSVVLVDFWASWCAPCRQENPELITLYEELHDDGLEILGVGLEFARDRWLDAIETDDLPWPNISDLTGFDMEAAQLFAVRALPANVLIDRSGTIVAKNLHGEDLRRQIDSIL